MFVEKVTSTGDQLIVDAARASFNRTHDLYTEEQNVGLLKFLVRPTPPHFVPYTHVRVALTLPHWAIIFKKLTQYNKAGMVEVRETPDMIHVSHSLWGWYKMLQEGCVHYNVVNSVVDHLYDAAPQAGQVLGLSNLRPSGQRPDEIKVDLAPTGNPELEFISLRIQCPIVIMRQLEKHQVGFTGSEASGRYIPYYKIYKPTEFHSKPENRKQGAGKPLTGVRKVLANAVMTTSHKISYWSYLLLHNVLGVAIEEARYCCPLSTATTRVVTASRQDWQRVLDHRISGDAQTDIRELAKLIREELERK